MLTLQPAHSSRLVRLLLGLMLAMALLPALSRLALAGQHDLVELCTVQGTRWVSLSTGEPGDPGLLPLADPCAACLLQAHGMAPPPALPNWQPDAQRTGHLAPPPRAPRLQALWRGASSRGPPRA